MKFLKTTFFCAILALTTANMANAQSLQDLFGGGTGNTLTNLIEGVFSSSRISIADMAGHWKSDGPAVCFQGEGFLKKAGGVAASAAIESKLDPYYKQYGLTGSTIDIEKDGSFVMKVKGISLKGTITKESGDGDGVFTFNFLAFGSFKIGSFTTYVQKTSQTMDIMFDATKFKTIVSAVAKFTGNSLASTLASVLDSYDGLCVGFHLSGTGNTGKSGGSLPADTQQIGNSLDKLRDALNKSKR